MEWTVAIGVDTHARMHVAVAVDRVGVADRKDDIGASACTRQDRDHAELGE